MFGRKDKKADRKRGREKPTERKGGDLASMFGLNMETPGVCVCVCVVCGVWCVCVYV